MDSVDRHSQKNYDEENRPSQFQTDRGLRLALAADSLGSEVPVLVVADLAQRTRVPEETVRVLRAAPLVSEISLGLEIRETPRIVGTESILDTNIGFVTVNGEDHGGVALLSRENDRRDSSGRRVKISPERLEENETGLSSLAESTGGTVLAEILLGRVLDDGVGELPGGTILAEETLIVVDESVLLSEDAIAADEIGFPARILSIILTPVIFKRIVESI